MRNSAFYSFFASSADNLSNSLDPNQDRKIVGPDLDPNRLTLIMFLKEVFEKVNWLIMLRLIG